MRKNKRELNAKRPRPLRRHHLPPVISSQAVNSTAPMWSKFSGTAAHTRGNLAPDGLSWQSVCSLSVGRKLHVSPVMLNCPTHSATVVANGSLQEYIRPRSDCRPRMAKRKIPTASAVPTYLKTGSGEACRDYRKEWKYKRAYSPRPVSPIPTWISEWWQS